MVLKQKFINSVPGVRQELLSLIAAAIQLKLNPHDALNSVFYDQINATVNAWGKAGLLDLDESGLEFTFTVMQPFESMQKREEGKEAADLARELRKIYKRLGSEYASDPEAVANRLMMFRARYPKITDKQITGATAKFVRDYGSPMIPYLHNFILNLSQQTSTLFAWIEKLESTEVHDGEWNELGDLD